MKNKLRFSPWRRPKRNKLKSKKLNIKKTLINRGQKMIPIKKKSSQKN